MTTRSNRAARTRTGTGAVGGLLALVLLLGTTESMVALCAPSVVWGANSDGQSLDVVNLVRQTTTFGTLGIVDGQTVRLSAVRAGDDAAKVCNVELNFFDIQGNRQGAGVSADLRSGHAEFLDLTRADVQPQPNDLRAQIYAVVDVTSEPAGNGDPKEDKPSCHVAIDRKS